MTKLMGGRAVGPTLVRPAGQALLPRAASTRRAGPREQDPSKLGSDLLVMAHFLLALVLVAWLNSGMGTPFFTQIPGAYRWGIAAVWVLASLASLRHTAEFATSAWPLLLFVALAHLVLPPSDGTGQAYLQNIVYVAVTYCIYSFYSGPRYHRYRKAIVGLVLLDVALVGIRTWVALDENPEISRYLATGNVYEDIVAQTADMWGVGGYPYAYALPAIMLLFLHRAITRGRYWVASWAVVLLGTVLLVRMAFSIAVIMWVVFALLLLVGETLGRRRQRVAVFLGLLVLPVGLLLGPTVLSFIARADSVPDVVAVRLHEVAAFVRGGTSADTDLAARLGQYGTSLSELSNNWLTGSAGSGLGMGPVGTHSSWLDTLGAFGLVSLLFFVFLLRVLRRQLSRAALSERFVVKMVWAYFAVLGVVNTLLFAHLILVWLVMVPFMVQSDGRQAADVEAP